MERKILKRVFEERAGGLDKVQPDSAQARWSEHKNRLEREKIWTAEDIFENKGPKINRPDYHLKVLRKHPIEGWYQVKELRDHSGVAHFLPERECTFRLFCKESHVTRAKQLLPD